MKCLNCESENLYVADGDNYREASCNECGAHYGVHYDASGNPHLFYMVGDHAHRFLPILYEAVAYYLSIHPLGGHCHIVLSDSNARNSDVRFCQKECIKKNDTVGAWLMSILIEIEEKSSPGFNEDVRLFILNNEWIYRNIADKMNAKVLG